MSSPEERHIERGLEFLRGGIWQVQPETAALRRGVGFLQFAVMMIEGFAREALLLRASALTYFTVLSLIPVVAIVIAIARSIGVGGAGFAQMIASLIVEQIAAGSPEAQAQIVGLIERANFGAVGTLGAGVLFVTTVLAIGNVERALNAIWGIQKQRPFGRRFADYLAVLIVAPLLLVFALSLAGSLQSQWVVQKMFEIRWLSVFYDIGLRQVPALVLAGAFTFLYWFLPNAKVKPAAAILGGIIAGVLVVVAQRLYVDLQVGVTRANALFGTFAALPLLFVWIYFFWTIVLIGALAAFTYQNLPLHRREARGGDRGPADREALAIYVAVSLATAFRDGARPWSAERLADSLRTPLRVVRSVLDELEAAGIASPCGGDEHEGVYQLGRAAETILVTDVLGAVRGTREPLYGEAGLSDAIETVLSEIEAGEARAAASRTLADVLAALPRAGDEPASDGELESAVS